MDAAAIGSLLDTDHRGESGSDRSTAESGVGDGPAHPGRAGTARRALDDTGLVSLVALAEVPLSVTRVARLLGVGWSEAADLVDDAIGQGLVVRHENRRSTVTMGSEAHRQAVRDSLSPAERRRLHEALAAELVGLALVDGSAGLLVDDVVAGARHAMAAETGLEVVLDLCRRAIDQCARSGDLVTAIDLVEQLTAAPVSVEDRIELLCVKAHLHGRLGEDKARSASYAAALDAAATRPTLRARVEAEMIATVGTIAPPDDAVAEIEELLRAGHEYPPRVRALLLVRRGEITVLGDAASTRRSLGDALAAARECDDDDAFALVCEAVVRLLPAVDQFDAEDVKRLRGSGLGRAVLHAHRIRRCLRSGTRGELDTLIDQYAAVLRDHPMAMWESDVLTHRAVQGLHDVDPERFRLSLEAAIGADRRHGPLGAHGRDCLVALWGHVTGTAAPIGREDVPRSSDGGVRDLLEVLQSVVDVAAGDADALETLSQRLAALPVIDADDWIGPTWWPLVCLAAGLVGDRDAAAAALDQMDVDPDSWVLFGSMVPVGPVGYFLAEAERVCGRTTSAHAHCDAGLDAAKRLRSMGWTARCALQKATLLVLDGDREAAVPFAESALSIGRRLGLDAVVAQSTAVLASVRPVLSGSEIEVLRLVADGLSNKQIARQLGVSVKRIENVLTSAYRRLGVSNRTQAVRAMTAQGPGPVGGGPITADRPRT